MQPWMYGKAGPPCYWDVPFPVDPLSDSYESKSLMGGHLISDPIFHNKPPSFIYITWGQMKKKKKPNDMQQ